MNVSIIAVCIVSILALIAFAFTYGIKSEWLFKTKTKLVFVLMTCLGFMIVILESREISFFLLMKQWPTAEAKIISSRVEGKRAFHPEIVYEYTVDDKTYTGATDMGVPGFGTKANRLNVASTNVVNNPVGKIITVHYDPQDPSFSQLRIVPTYTTFILLSIGSLLLGAGLWGVLTIFVMKK